MLKKDIKRLEKLKEKIKHTKLKIISKDYVDYEYEEVKAYLDLEIERFAK